MCYPDIQLYNYKRHGEEKSKSPTETSTTVIRTSPPYTPSWRVTQ